MTSTDTSGGDLLLAIDAGTGSCRAVLFDSAGRQVGARLREWTHREPAGVPGGQDFDVEANWAAIAACTAEVLAAADAAPARVRAVSTTSMREGIVLYDREGRELWACPNVDSRASEQADELVADGRAEAIYRESGDWVSITSPARLLWLAQHRPDILERTTSLGLLSDWIGHRLCGATVTEPSCGSSSGLFDLAARSWSKTITAMVGLDPSVLPPVVAPGEVIGAVSRRAAEQTGLAEGTPVVAGGADTQLGLLGAGIRPGEFTVVAGTFWQNTVLLPTPVVDPQMRLRTLCHVLDGQWMLEGIGFYCGMSMRWFRDAFCADAIAEGAARGIDPYVVMEETAESIPPGSNGVIAILSNIMNARRWVHASPSFLQFDLGRPADTGRAACVRAIEEAAAYVARGHRDIITELAGTAPTRTVFTGGAAKGRLWPQVLADVLGTAVEIPTVTESSALGAAICAGTGVGIFASLDEPRDALRSMQRTVEPGPDATSAYDEYYDHWSRLYPRVLELSETGLLNPLWRAAGA